MSEAEKDSKIGYVFGFNAVLADGINFNIQGNFQKGATEKEMGHELDRLREVVERQRARNEIPIFEASLEELRRQLKATEFDLQQRQSDKKVERSHIERLRMTVEDVQERIASGEKKLAEAREKAK
ncbi:MAG: hypothetical protein KGL63_06645 [Betaproteobacteria bacterium]|nr:hypothetical protein [Betaproteobacteria bacterium]